VYGICKLKAEEEALKKRPESLVIRSSSALFGPWEPENFVIRILRGLHGEQEFANEESVVSPTYVPDLVNHALDLLLDGESGIWHLANSGHTTWADLLAMTREIGRVEPEVTLPPAHVPAATFRALTSEKACVMPHWADALRRFFRECNVVWNEPTDEEEVVAA
jgi:dTDP-4-dehydrorhamnose reductase